MFTFIHAADIHLDSPMHKLNAYDGAPVEQFRLSTRRAFENMVELAISEQASFVLISGDLYDGDWKDYNTGLYLINQMIRLKQAGIMVFIVTGNHDAASTITKSLRMPDNVVVFNENHAETRKVGGFPVVVHGRSFASPAEKKDLSEDYPPALPGFFNIGMLHTCATGRPGHEPYAPCTIEGLSQKGYQYWALGHVHQHEILSKNPWIVFPGNTQGRHIRESGPKGCLKVTVGDNMDVHLDFITTDVVRWATIRVDATDIREPFEIVDAFAAGLENVVFENSGMPMAVRAQIAGITPAGAEISADPHRWSGEIKAAAMQAGSGLAWIEKISFSCSMPENMEHSVAGGAMEELQALFDELEADPEACGALSQELADFYRKLPRELKQGPDAIRCDDPDWINNLLKQVRPELVGRLMRKGNDI